jgi:hypoxanthine phosphoribosyltransferase
MAKDGSFKTMPIGQRLKRTKPKKRRKPAAGSDPRAATAGPARDASEVRDEGFRELTWGGFDALAHVLARKLTYYDPELVIGIVKGGLFVGSALAGFLRREFIPVRLAKRSRDRERLSPGVRSEVPPEVKGKRVLVVDDVVQSGETLRQATAAIAAAGAIEVRSAALVVHRSHPKARSAGRGEADKVAKAKDNRPDWFALETDDLVVFPWDYELRAVGASDQDPGESGA